MAKTVMYFEKDSLHKVVHKDGRVPFINVDLHLDPSEVRNVEIPFNGEERFAYVLSELTLDSGVYVSSASFRTGVAETVSLQLAPGLAQVIPIPDTIDGFRVTSNAPGEGKVKLVVL